MSIPTELASQLETYYRLLTVWNAKINLTGLKLLENSPEAIDRLLIEPLVASRYVPSGSSRVLDVGSGSGSPAIPLALATPGMRLVMVESKTRKSVFLREAVRTLGLTGAEVVTARFEELLARPDVHEAQDLVTMRAVRIESAVLGTLQAFVKPGGLVFLFRGSAPFNGSEVVRPPLGWKATYPLIESSRSQLVVLEKRAVGPLLDPLVPRGTVQR